MFLPHVLVVLALFTPFGVMGPMLFSEHVCVLSVFVCNRPVSPLPKSSFPGESTCWLKVWQTWPGKSRGTFLFFF